MKKMVKVIIDGKEIEVEEGTTVLEAARKAGIKIPTLCHAPFLKPQGACRMCIVKIEGVRGYPTSCTTPVRDGMVIYTNTAEVIEQRRFNFQLLLGMHRNECLSCPANGSCELQKLAEELGITRTVFELRKRPEYVDDVGPSVVRNVEKCILCGRCVRTCNEMQTVGALSFAYRGVDSMVITAYNEPIGESACVNCGQCVLACPTGALSIKEDYEELLELLRDPKKRKGKVFVVQIAPAVRVSIGEEFGLEPGEIVLGQLVTALRMLGFDYVFDTNFGADLTVVEEGSEFVNLIKEKGEDAFLMTSCCPAWVKFCEEFFPEMTKYISSAKSPQGMTGALVKTYFAKKIGKDPKDVISVSIMPCTAKKFERLRPEHSIDGLKAIDYVITTRELAKMIKLAGLDLKNLPESKEDEPLGIYTGAGAIFGATGGVMEAALRTAYELYTGKTLEKVEFAPVRGLEYIKEAEIEMNGLKLKVAVAHTLGAARKLLEQIKSGKKKYNFIEVMACLGGCIGGGGQPKVTADKRFETLQKRIDGIYAHDRSLKYRKSHENPAVKKIYEEFLGEPHSEKAKELLHVRGYVKRNGYGV